MTKDVALQETSQETRDVAVEDLQMHFGDYLEEVRRGKTLRLIEGERVVAVMKPIQLAERPTPDDMIFRKATTTWADFEPPPPIEAEIDVVALLREDRDAR